MIKRKREQESSGEPLLFDPADALPFKPGLFEGKSTADLEIAKLTVEAVRRTTGKGTADEEELEIEQAIVLLNSHRDELEALAELDEPQISKKKIALLITILAMFMAFIIVFFLASKLLGNSTSVRPAVRIDRSR